MKMPGFSAEASLYPRRNHNDWSEGGFQPGEAVIVPQARALAKCQARCLGGYIGSAATCVGSSNSDLCISTAGNRYGRCNDMCDLLYG